MAAKLKKRLSKIENKLPKLENLELKDVICSICQSILVEPVTLPCFHNFCQHCFNGSVENNALCCPLCRLRIGSWLRTATKQKSLVNVELWKVIKCKFPEEIDIKLKGEDIQLPEEKPILRLSAPGEIRSEYEAEMKRLRAERLQLEQKQIQETELLINKLQEEENEAHRKHEDALKRDAMLAQTLQEEQQKQPSTSSKQKNVRHTMAPKPKLKPSKIDHYLCKKVVPPDENSPLITDDNTSISSAGQTPKLTNPYARQGSPEMVPSYGKMIKTYLDKKLKNASSIWNKDNVVNNKKEEVASSSGVKHLESCQDKCKIKSKTATQSVLVSLPLPSAIQHSKLKDIEKRSLETGSVDSMRQELCYFKPINASTPTSFSSNKGSPVRVPGIRPGNETGANQKLPSPSREQYLESFCKLRNLSLAQNLPSAFAIALTLLHIKKDNTVSSKVKLKKSSPSNVPTSPVKKTVKKQCSQVDGAPRPDATVMLRRTRSMGSLTKEENESTPKKAKVSERKAVSERKPHLRSDSKKTNGTKHMSPILVPETINNNSFSVKNLSSPLKNCAVKKILQEQLRIEKIIEQEKSDFELAQKMEAEWNGRRLRGAVKRQATLNYALRPAKKLRV